MKSKAPIAAGEVRVSFQRNGSIMETRITIGLSEDEFNYGLVQATQQGQSPLLNNLIQDLKRALGKQVPRMLTYEHVSRSYRRKMPVITAWSPRKVGENIDIETPDGVMVARYGDWIIQLPTGERYVLDEPTFTALYEPV